jgi:hypothetical protein
LDLLRSRQLHRRHRRDFPGVIIIIMPPGRALHGRHTPPPRHPKMMKMFPLEPSYAWWESAIPTRTYYSNAKLRLPLRLFFIFIVIAIAIVRMNPVTVVVGYRTSIAEYSYFSSRRLAIAVATTGRTCPVRVCCCLAVINFLAESH